MAVTGTFVEQTPLYSTSSGGSLVVPMPASRAGDVLIAMYALHVSDAPDLPPRPPPPSGWSDGPKLIDQIDPLSASAYADLKGRTGLFFHISQPDTDSTYEFDAGSTLTDGSGSIWAVSVAVIRGARVVGFTGFNYDTFWRCAAQSTSPGLMPAGTLAGTDRFSVAVTIGNWPALGNSGLSATWTLARETHTLDGRGASVFIQTSEPTESFEELPGDWVDSTSTVGYTTWGITFQPVITPVTAYPAVADPFSLRLECASEYEVFVTSNDYRTRLAALSYGGLSWSRVLDEISEATVTVPDTFDGAGCLARLGGVRPWRYGLLVERDSQEVWSGPLVSVERDPGSVTEAATLRLKAGDVIARYRMRLATRGDSLRFVNSDAGVVFQRVTQYAAHANDAWSMPVPTVVIQAPVSREIVARDFELAYDVLKELLDSSIDAYVLNGVLVMFEPGAGWRHVDPGGATVTLPGPYNSSGELVYGLFTEQAFSSRPGWSMDGMSQVNRSWVPGSDSGELGFREYWTSQASQNWHLDGVLDGVEVDSLYRTGGADVPIADSVFQRHADSMVALRAEAPAVISGGALADGAPITMEHLRPGSIWNIDVFDDGFDQLLQAVRLKRIDVDVNVTADGVEERIVPTLQPVGYTP